MEEGKRITMTEEMFRSLKGGTLIEYAMGRGQQEEWSRANILDVVIVEKSVSITTDGKGYYQTSDPKESDCWISSRGVYTIHEPMLGIVFAMAPPGVEISKPRSWPPAPRTIKVNSK